MPRVTNPWLKLGIDSWMLGVEATSVIGLRTMRVATGAAGSDAECQLMVAEKVRATLELQTLAMTGALGLTPHRAAARTVAHYRRKVRANQRRLMKAS